MNNMPRNNAFNEEQLELAIIELFKDQGYQYVHGDTIHRRREDVLLEEDLVQFLQCRYASEGLTAVELQKIINKLKLISATPLYSGNKETFFLLNEGFDLAREDATKVALHVDFIDYDTPTNNVFKVVNQFTVQGESVRRPDLLVFLNGIPVAIWEFKSAIKEDTTIYDAWEQINKRYNRDIPSLMRYCLLSVICDGANTRMASIFSPYQFYFAWNKANEDDTVSNGISSLLTMVKGAFSQERLLSILRDFIFYPDSSAKEQAIVCRYPQYFAANHMLDNIKRHVKPNGDGKGGVYFGATGCGKTYTMMFLSRLLIRREQSVFRNPTVVILVDREDLDSQASELFVTATRYLGDGDVRSIESRQDLIRTLADKPSGGVYITTIQKFCESTGLLSDRENIICISDEAHRTQTGIGSKLKKTKSGLIDSYGFAQYLRWGFPNATYCGFTGTPIDETIAVFGEIVDSYTMKESTADGITVRIAYEPRLARVLLSDAQAKEIQKYYDDCAVQGATEDQIEASKRAMASIAAIIGHPDVIQRMATDIVAHYESLCQEKPKIVQKAMIVCANRELAYQVLKAILDVRPQWGESRKSIDESCLSKEQLDELESLPMINLVATQGQNDAEDLYRLCGTKAYRQMLDKQFKNVRSNFRIAVVVDMWITGFDVPSLAVMYINKPLQQHTLIQTISRVNRVFEGKDRGLIVDYIGIKDAMMEAIKRYGGKQESPIDEIQITLGILRNHLSLIDEELYGFDATRYYNGAPLRRLQCLNDAAEFVQQNQDRQLRFMGLSQRMKSAFQIVFPTGELTDGEVAKAQFYMAIRSIVYKQTKGDAPDTEIMNGVVEKMVKEAITCTGVENVVDDEQSVELFSREFMEHLDQVRLPITKFNALLKLLKKAIMAYGRVNKVKAIEFDERLKKVVEIYNTRDQLIFTNEVVADFMERLSGSLLDILNDLKKDQSLFEELGITYEEKAFYDILIKTRDDHGFDYDDEKCLALAKQIKALVDDKAQYADWSTRLDIKNQMQRDLKILLYRGGYPPTWNQEVFEKVIEQAENFKKYAA